QLLRPRGRAEAHLPHRYHHPPGGIMNGSSILLRVNKGTTEAPDWEVIPCQTNLDVTIAIGAIGRSRQDAAGNQCQPGGADITASAEVYLTEWPEINGSTSEAHARLLNWALGQQLFDAQILADGVPTWEMDAFITNVGLTAPREDSSTMSIDLRITG